MLLRCAVLVFYLNFVSTEVIHSGKSAISDVDDIFSLWPSIHNGVKLMRLRKREAETQKPELPTTVKPIQSLDQSAGQSLEQVPAQKPAQHSQQILVQEPAKPPSEASENTFRQLTESPVALNKSENAPVTNSNPKDEHPVTNDIKVPVNPAHNVNLANGTETKSEVNATVTGAPPKINLSDPGVLKRAFIVFGGFALLGAAYYFIFYRKKNSNNDAKNTHSSIDPNQFRYGVLQSEDKRNNLELSRVPLTMESDDDDDEDLEIFDLGQKKKSLSYINLEQHDEDIVLNDSRSIDMENLLVDIEDKNSDTLINWSSSGSKSIL
ncbi:hypothetical protein MSG28_001481 [Choristoneura fumiferana]|uniref:Uncharacterized protein n=1 Tax=Choristoneura fumiferana TaxID=7141 RepID=A0ACC0KUT8_CHOFU|nr:hypothetical protein MSG28_001481 [Choristoneura fumiferana]